MYCGDEVKIFLAFHPIFSLASSSKVDRKATESGMLPTDFYEHSSEAKFAPLHFVVGAFFSRSGCGGCTNMITTCWPSLSECVSLIFVAVSTQFFHFIARLTDAAA